MQCSDVFFSCKTLAISHKVYFYFLRCVLLVTALEEFWVLMPSAIMLIELMRVGTVAGEEASAASR